MKKTTLILTIFIALIINSCDTYSTYATSTSNVWLEFELPPSRILNNGDVFFESTLSDGTKISVYSDREITMILFILLYKIPCFSGKFETGICTI